MKTEDYESDDIMMTKCIPSKNKNFMCLYDMNTYPKAKHSPKNTTLDNFKLTLLTKCFSAIWNQESEENVMKGLYLFLNEIFALFFKKSCSGDQKESTMDNHEEERKKMKTRVETNFNKSDVSESADKKTIQKLETFILSVTLNRLMITYSESLKFYFTLESLRTLKFVGDGCALKLYRKILCSNFQNFSGRQHFLKTFNVVLSNAILRPKLINSNERELPVEIDNSENSANSYEPIYQPIWKCSETVALDHHDWEIDPEFCFVDAKNKAFPDTNMYESVCILYSDENPELNKIIYSYKSSASTEISVNSQLHTSNNDKTLQSYSMIQHEPNDEVFDSVIAWKDLLRHSFYLEDEDDIVTINIFYNALIMYII